MPTKTLLAILATTALIWGLHFVPQLNWLSGPDLATLERVVGIQPPAKVEPPKEEPPPPPREVIIDVPPPAPTGNASTTIPHLPVNVKPPDVETGPPTSLADATGQMHFFFESLARTQARQPGSVTRILHYGDSPVTADSITADARAMLQSQYGDAGHGFVLIAKPWAWYMHRGIDITAAGWRMEPASQSHARDNLHGLGGVSFTGSVGATTKITLPRNTRRPEVPRTYARSKAAHDDS